MSFNIEIFFLKKDGTYPNYVENKNQHLHDHAMHNFFESKYFFLVPRATRRSLNDYPEAKLDGFVDTNKDCI